MSRVVRDYVDVDFGMRAGENVGFCAIDDIERADWGDEHGWRGRADGRRHTRQQTGLHRAFRSS